MMAETYWPKQNCINCKLNVYPIRMIKKYCNHFKTHVKAPSSNRKNMNMSSILNKKLSVFYFVFN